LTIAPLSIPTITTTQTVFQLNNNALTLTGGGYIPLSAGVTNLYQGTGQVLWIHVTASVTGAVASTTTVVVDVYAIPASALPLPSTDSSATVVGLSTIIGALSAGTVDANGDCTVSYDAYIQFSADGEINGTFQGVIGTVSTAKTVITPFNLSGGEADLNFLATVTCGGSATTGTITPNEFSLSYV
jgi:acetaldehyde dehydrogenase (acetylating)